MLAKLKIWMQGLQLVWLVVSWWEMHWIAFLQAFQADSLNPLLLGVWDKN